MPLRRGEPDPDAGEAAGPDRDRDEVERRGGQPRSRIARVDHRQQRLGLAVRNRPVLGAEHPSPAPTATEQADPAASSARISGSSRAPMQMRRIQTARTSTTSGM